MLCDSKMPTKGKGKLFKNDLEANTVVLECESWASKAQNIHKISITDMSML